ncbi:MAG: vacuolar membrane-associated protein iml1 [Piccolia ochrophora]|nr:MAG: vacuolar membrane-associated protein iml1 [Piccolia ochrophora]
MSSNIPATSRPPSLSEPLRLNVRKQSPAMPDTHDPNKAPLEPLDGTSLNGQGSRSSGRLCTLWVNESYSKEEVVLSAPLLSQVGAQVGDLLQIVAINSHGANNDFQDVSTPVAEHAVPRGTDVERRRWPDVSSETREKNIERKDQRPDDQPVQDNVEQQRQLPSSLRYLFFVKESSVEQKKHSNLEISLAGHVASALGFKRGMQVMVSVTDEASNAASHVELVFRDVYLARSDMWRLALSELSNKVVYKGQNIFFLGSIKARVREVYVQGREALSAYFVSSTKPIFRSESARYVLLLQMSKEMWDFDSDASGEIVFSKVINGFLPQLFRRWRDLAARHLVTIVLFTRVYFTRGTTSYFAADRDVHTIQHGGTSKVKKPYKDFYRVVVSEMSSGEWLAILDQLKREFKIFRRDISIQKTSTGSMARHADQGKGTYEDEVPPYVVAGQPSASVYGNILEAISMATLQFVTDYIDRDLVRTGISLIVVTPGSGLFEVDYSMLQSTTDLLVSNGIGIDLLCLSKVPLHSAPLFKYRTPSNVLQEPYDHAKLLSGESTPRQKHPAFGSVANQATLLSPSRSLEYATTLRLGRSHPPQLGEWSFAIPHWLDVSFWSGRTTKATRLHNADTSDGKLNGVARHHWYGFLPRVKMYELQMMGIMENEMSNISIPYLHESRFYPNVADPFSSHDKTLSSQAPKPLGQPFAVNSHRAGDQSRLPTTSAFASGLRDHVLSKDEKEILKWMDEYDSMVFRPSWQQQAIKRAEAVDLKVHADDNSNDDASVYGKSFIDHSRSPRGLNIPEGAAYFDRKMKERYLEEDQPGLRMVGTKGSPRTGSKNRRPSHIFSSGLRGFNAVPPKATASTELRVDHAQPGGVLSRAPPTKSSASSALEVRKNSTITIRNASSSAQADIPRILDDDPPTPTTNSGSVIASRPIAIKSTLNTPDKARSSKVTSDVDSMYDHSSLDRKQSERIGGLRRDSLSKHAPDVIANAHQAPTGMPTQTASWWTLVQPSNTEDQGRPDDVRFGRWLHIFPYPLRTSSIRWKSLCSPASVPLTTECFPSRDQLTEEYHESPYRILQNDDDELNENPKARDELIKELIALRLNQGFQFVVGPAVAETMGRPSLSAFDVQNAGFTSEGAMIIMSSADTIHQLQCVEGGEVEVKRFVRKQMEFAQHAVSFAGSAKSFTPSTYKARIRTTFADAYESRHVSFQIPPDNYNWNYVDSFIAGYEDSFSDHLRFWRARFVLIPVEQASSHKNHLHTLHEDNDEEIRLEGIRKLTQLWQRYRHVPLEERRFQSPLRRRKDTNPLDIVYQTRDPSAVIAAELDTLPLAENEQQVRKSQLFTDKEPFQRANVNIADLAQEIQGEKGVPMQDRRWHWRLHYNCFIGFEMTTWLLANFRDVENRDEAVEFGNELMEKGLFQHVEKRHQFRDGNFFYQLGSEHRNTRPDSRRSWFGTRRSDKSVPSTPISEGPRDSPRVDRSRSSSNNDEEGAQSSIATPTTNTDKKLRVVLSKVMKYDVDPRKRSYRPELINLHYDRLHNPDNCYHIRLDWVNVTAKLIEDSIVSWATTAEKYGLKLVEVPIAEAACISMKQPFRSPLTIPLAAAPPSHQPKQTYFDATSLAPQPQPLDKHYYHKLIMKKFNFVLDTEAKTNFPPNVDVSYSWGHPDYENTQYIHRSGVLLAQITSDGDFLLLANRLYTTRSSTASATNQDRFANSPHHSHAHQPSQSPLSSPLVRAAPDPPPLTHANHPTPSQPHTNPALTSPSYATPALIKSQLESFCRDADALKAFYDDQLTRAKLSSPTSTTTPSTPAVSPPQDSGIPTLGLPPSMTAAMRARESSPSPIPSLSEVMGVAAAAAAPRSEGSRKGSGNEAQADAATRQAPDAEEGDEKAGGPDGGT